MKRFILILAVMMYTGLCANAMTVQYMGGHPSRVMHASGRSSSINNFGANAAFLPQNRAAESQRLRMVKMQREYARLRGENRFARPYGYYDRPYGYSKPYGYGTPHSVKVPPQSRFDRNYQITSQSHSYTRNGVTYFD